MKCIYCGNLESRVLDTRQTDEGVVIRRRRECVRCGKRFTSYEKLEIDPVFIVKKDGRREPFSPDKLRDGIIKACGKRPVALSQVDSIVNDVEKRIANSLEQEVTSVQIGEMVMENLKRLDEVAYVRFASVYRSFSDMDSFLQELLSLKRSDDLRKEAENAHRQDGE